MDRIRTLFRYSVCALLLAFVPAVQAAPQTVAQLPQKWLLIGLIPEMNIFRQKQRFKLLGDYLAKKTGLPVEFTILSRYGNIIESFKTEKMDGAFFGSFTGALAIRKLGVVPLARPVNLDDSSTYHGYMFVRKDSGITTAASMRGKRMAFVEKATTAGYLFPLAYLREQGIANIDGFFRDSIFTGSHDAAILKAVLEKFGALRFIETTANDYQPVIDLAGKAGIDLRTYRYRND